MNKTIVIVAISGLLAQALLAATKSHADQTSCFPNVIMILIDDMGLSDSAPYGSRYYDTPNLTRLGV